MGPGSNAIVISDPEPGDSGGPKIAAATNSVIVGDPGGDGLGPKVVVMPGDPGARPK